MKCCFRCGRPASITLKLEAVVNNQRLKLAQDASDNAICSYCMIKLGEWVKTGQTEPPSVAQVGPLTNGVVD